MRADDRAADQPSADEAGGPPSLAEVKQLWWFCDGAIMNVDTRDHLWRARGLCPRHTWMYFCAETELKYQPLGNAVLYEDLVGRAAGLLHRRRPDRRKRSELATGASCFTCDYAATAHGTPTGFAPERDQVAAANRTRQWVRGSRAVWDGSVCGQCRPSGANADGVLCRRHLITAGGGADSARAAAYLDTLRIRTARCVRSMTFDGPPREPDTDAALVEALGWFAGWRAGTPYLG